MKLSSMRFRQRYYVVFWLCIVFVSSSLMGCNTRNTSSLEMVHAIPVYEFNFPFAYMIQRDDGGFCTAAAISPRAAITSAHCIYDKNSRPTKWIHATNANQEYATKDFRIHPKYNDKDDWKIRRNYDLAVFRFQREWHSSYLEIAKNPLKSKQVYRQIGFGKSGLNKTPSNHDPLRGYKQLGTNRYLDDVKPLNEDFFNLNTSEIREKLGLYVVPAALIEEVPKVGSDHLESGGSFGDSGGPIFVDKLLYAVHEGAYPKERVQLANGQIVKKRLTLSVDLTSLSSRDFLSALESEGFLD